MIRLLLNYLSGTYTVQISACDVLEVLNILRANGYTQWRMRRDADGGISFRMLRRDAELFAADCEKKSICVHLGDVHGLPDAVRRFKGRWGILIGSLLFILILWLSVSVVWSVEITGNTETDVLEIRSWLRENGFHEGVFFRQIDFDIFQNKLLLSTDKLSWIAINMIGTTAHVEVREANYMERSKDGQCANIVAAEDGQIVQLRVDGGRSAVSIHDTVQKGELLISGLMTIRGTELRYEYAAGEVLAQVNRRIVIEIPLVRTEKVYTGEECTRKSVIFFGKEIKLFQNAGFEGTTYDTIIENILLYPSDSAALPVYIKKVTERRYTDETITVSEADALREADVQFGRALAELQHSAEILSIEKSSVCTGGIVTVCAELVCITDIARIQEILIS